MVGVALGIHGIIFIQDAAEKLGEDITRFEDNSGPMMEAAKKIANMWMKMAELIKSVL